MLRNWNRREGWKKEGDSKLDYTKISIDKIAEDNSAMSFPVKFEPGKNEWEDGARMTSPMNIFSYEDCQKYDALAMNVYLEQGKATNGKIQLELCSTPNGDGYWYQSGKFTSDPLTGEKVITPDGKQLQKYYVYIGMTQNQENVKKIKEYYQMLGYIVDEETFSIEHKNFLDVLKKYDEMLNATTDKNAIASIINDVLSKYEELVSIV